VERGNFSAVVCAISTHVSVVPVSCRMAMHYRVTWYQDLKGSHTVKKKSNNTEI